MKRVAVPSTRHGGENNNVTATGVRFTTNANASHDVYFVDDAGAWRS